MLDLHANATSTDLTIGDPRCVVEVPGLLDDQVILIRETSILVELANVVLPGITLLGPSRRHPFPAVDVLVCPSRV
jgi:hypothetical protein